MVVIRIARGGAGGGAVATGMQWGSGIVTVGITSVFNAFDSTNSWPTSAGQQQSPTPFAATFQNMTFRTASNSFDEATTVTFTVSAAPTILVLTVPASASGTFSDLVNQIAVIQLALISQNWNTNAATVGTSQVRGNGVGYTIP